MALGVEREARLQVLFICRHRRERILPSGCGHIVVSLSQDFLTDCPEDRPEQRTAPALMVGQRSVYEIVATADLVDWPVSSSCLVPCRRLSGIAPI
jgi:hypothetical protein